MDNEDDQNILHDIIINGDDSELELFEDDLDEVDNIRTDSCSRIGMFLEIAQT